jgi:hypothetical protein
LVLEKKRKEKKAHTESLRRRCHTSTTMTSSRKELERRKNARHVLKNCQLRPVFEYRELPKEA